MGAWRRKTKLLHIINKTHPTIKFTVDWSKTSINFLDVTVTIAEGVIETDLYVKPTDIHQYLLLSSCHPFSCKNGIPYSRALRLKKFVETMSFLIKDAMAYRRSIRKRLQ